VAILLTLLGNRAAPPFLWAYAARVLANLRAVEALPALQRLARFSQKREVRAAARRAFDRINRERQAQQPGRFCQRFWQRLAATLRDALREPHC
jgi:hypothetical protein